MKPLIDKEFLLPDESVEEVLSALAERFQVIEDAGETHSEVYWDTFDWRVFADGATLVELPGPVPARGGGELAWRDLRGETRQQVRLDGGTFDGELPPGLEALAPVIGIRRLMPQVEVRLEGPRLRVLDEQQKTVVRLRLLRGVSQLPAGQGGEASDTSAGKASSAESPMPTRLRVEPLRGYGEHESEVLRFLDESFALPTCEKTLFESALEAVGRKPGDYSSKVRLDLGSDPSALQAAVILHQELLGVLVANEPGLRANLDSEFLHDFRVAVRRTRSALSQLRGVFTEDAVEHFKSEFRWLGRLTGPTRDLDVYLLKIPGYRGELPKAAQRALEPLEHFLYARQRLEHQRLVDALDSSRYRDLIDAWRIQLKDPAPGPAAEERASELASSRIYRAFRKLIERGRAIDDDTPAEALHEVRILGKKLRYTLELFRSLFPAEEVDRSINELKRLQDNLGDFNDYEVQQKALGRFAAEMAQDWVVEMRSSNSAQDMTSTLLAMGRLQAHLDDGRHAERHRFGRRFKRFASAENRRLFRALFKR